VLDGLDRAIKEYLTSLDVDALSDAEHRRRSEIVAFTTNIEHAGDILVKSLMPLAAKQIKRGIAFSDTNRDEIRTMIDRLITNTRAAAAVFLTEDPGAARQLLAEKEVFRDVESLATQAHFGMPRGPSAESVDVSRLHIDMLRDLKRVNAHLSAAAYPVLERRGELLRSRLRHDAE